MKKLVLILALLFLPTFADAAFRKDVTTASGVLVKHWRIAETSTDYENQILVVKVKGWMTKTLYQNGATPESVETFVFSGADFPLHPTQSENTRDLIEAAVLTKPFFSGAIAD